MKVEMIPNRGPASLGAEIARGLEWANEVDIASAYVTPKALAYIRGALTQAQKRKEQLTIRLLFGLYQRFTPPRALDEMLGLKRNFPGMFYARIARNNRFHWKLYIFRKNDSRRIYIGSGNLTKDGLTTEGELSLKISSKSSDSITSALEAEFNDTWHRDSFTLRKPVADKYRLLKRPPETFVKLEKDGAISDLLRNAEKAEELPVIQETSARHRPRAALVDADLKLETTKIISAETNWDECGWYYIGNSYKYYFELLVNAKVFLYVTWYDRKSKVYWLEFHEVRATAIIDTPDGKYFVAHSRIPGGWCVKYEDAKEGLKKIGLTWKKMQAWAAITDEQLGTLCRLLHVKLDKLWVT